MQQTFSKYIKCHPKGRLDVFGKRFLWFTPFILHFLQPITYLVLVIFYYVLLDTTLPSSNISLCTVDSKSFTKELSSIQLSRNASSRMCFFFSFNASANGFTVRFVSKLALISTSVIDLCSVIILVSAEPPASPIRLAATSKRKRLSLWRNASQRLAIFRNPVFASDIRCWTNEKFLWTAYAVQRNFSLVQHRTHRYHLQCIIAF